MPLSAAPAARSIDRAPSRSTAWRLPARLLRARLLHTALLATLPLLLAACGAEPGSGPEDGPGAAGGDAGSPSAAASQAAPAPAAASASLDGLDPRLAPYVAALEQQGRDPVAFVLERLAEHDLLIFDDALHSAVEPFDLYRRLVRTPEVVEALDALYLELVPVNRQSSLDAYLASDPEDPSLLLPAFQDDTGGLGMPYQTYFDLLHDVWAVNRGLPPERRLRVVGVNTPTWWSEIRSEEDLRHYRRSLSSRDHQMYKLILDDLAEFGEGRKGLFLTNTRHAYKDVRGIGGTPFWNTGTFFHRWHPGRSYSIRLHNVALFIEGAKGAAGEGSIEGLDRYEYRWGRLEDGLWDAAYTAYRERTGTRAVAVPLWGTPFGQAAYVGNHMHVAAPGQTMLDAYDAVMFLAPLEAMRQTAHRGDLYTPEFRREAARRWHLLHPGEEGRRQLEAEGVASPEALLETLAEGRPEGPLSLVEGVGPEDAWRSGGAPD